jgi:hypothetical protein
MSTDGNGAVLDKISQLLCGIQGHDEMLEFDGSRMFLRCVNCGHETPGWDVRRGHPGPAHQPDESPIGADTRHTRRAA